MRQFGRGSSAKGFLSQGSKYRGLNQFLEGIQGDKSSNEGQNPRTQGYNQEGAVIVIPRERKEACLASAWGDVQAISVRSTAQGFLRQARGRLDGTSSPCQLHECMTP